MATVTVEIGLTLCLKGRIKGATQFEFMRPTVKIADIDTDGDLSVKKQLDLCRKAIKPVWDTVDTAVEKLLEEQFEE